MRVTVDRNVCQGHGVCLMMAEKLFAISDEDGLAYVTQDPVPNDQRDLAMMAMNNCPERAISISEN